MPEYLAPGVYVEETSFRAKSIEGVSTSTAGFVGPARYGPVDGTPTLVTSFAEFDRIFGFPRPDPDDPNDQGVDTTAWGRASATVANGIAVRARYPGRAGGGRVS